MFLDILNELMAEKGINKSILSKESGVPYTTIDGFYKKGCDNIKLSTLEKIADYFGVTIDFLLGKTEKGTDNIDALGKFGVFPISYKKFRVLGEIACGEPIYADEDRETIILANSNIDADFCLYAKGDSMIGARIMDGDIVFIKQCSMVQNGEIAAVIIEDEATLKRVYYYPDKNKIVLSSENPKYEPFVYIGEELDSIRILGKAVAFQSAVR